VRGRQFEWGALLLKSSGGAYKGSLGAYGKRAGRVMAQASLTVRHERRADTKVEHNEPMIRIRCGRRLSDKSYSGDNRLVPPKRP
jgi:Family of unknown function (DUF6467)